MVLQAFPGVISKHCSVCRSPNPNKRHCTHLCICYQPPSIPFCHSAKCSCPFVAAQPWPTQLLSVLAVSAASLELHISRAEQDLACTCPCPACLPWHSALPEGPCKLLPWMDHVSPLISASAGNQTQVLTHARPVLYC